MNFRLPVLFSSCIATFSFAAEPVHELPTVRVTETPALADRYQLPQVVESVAAPRIAETVNLLDPEDAVKYLPSVFLRKRNNGDTQAVMATRVWGVSSSARSLVYADGVLLSALIANNNNIGGPRWGLISPAEIERVDLMYGPFAAAYPGNSMGAVLEITTREPEKFTATLGQTFAWQNFQQYGTHDTFRTSQTGLSVGNRVDQFSFWFSGNFQDSASQPLSYVTSSTFPNGTSGGFAEKNKFSQPANVVGASGLQHSRTVNAKFKVGYDFGSMLRASYTLGLWRDDAAATAQTYLRDAAGVPTFAGLAGFASGTYDWRQQHSSHSLALKSDTRGAFDFDAIATLYRMDRDEQRLPVTASASGTSFSPAGRIAVLGGTGWSTLDLKGTWRPEGGGKKTSEHLVTFGAHDDRYRLYNPTFNTSDWRGSGAFTGVFSEGDGKTHTQALWAQDVWRVRDDVKLTLGARYETWRGYDGLNVNGGTRIVQPEVRTRGFSPKISAAWTLAPGWALTASVAQANRFATPAELYQLVSTGTTFTAPNAQLKPDDVIATELKLERTLENGRVRLSLFQDDVHDAIIAQFSPLVPGSAQLFSFASNVDHMRARGVEVVVRRNHVFLSSLELEGSATFVDARTLATQGRGQFGSAIGKRLPNIPDWRATMVATWRPNERWALTLAGRYSGMMTTTLDAADTNSNTWQGFGAWFVADARLTCRFGQRWTAALGADNLLNRSYFVFHPFPQRTIVADLKFSF